MIAQNTFRIINVAYDLLIGYAEQDMKEGDQDDRTR